MTVMKTYKYKLYQTKRNKHLDRQIEIASEVWNYCVAMERRYYKSFNKYLPANRLKTHITKLKRREKYKHWNELGSQAVQDAVERVDRSYKAFFDHVIEGRKGRKSPPRFCKRQKYRSFTLKQAGYRFHDENYVTIMGRDYTYFAHRPFDGTIKTLTVKRSSTGDYFIYVVCQVTVPNVYPRTGKAIGLDFGLKHFLMSSDGEKIESPRWLENNIRELRAASRKISRCQKGRKNRSRAVKDLARIQEHISNSRRDRFFKLSHQLVDESVCIGIEDLNLDAMKRLWGRKVSDYAFAEFVTILRYVAETNGACVVKAGRWDPSTKKCHVCKTLVPPIPLDQRVWVCLPMEQRMTETLTPPSISGTSVSRGRRSAKSEPQHGRGIVHFPRPVRQRFVRNLRGR